MKHRKTSKTNLNKRIDRDNPSWSEEMLGPPEFRVGRAASKKAGLSDALAGQKTLQENRRRFVQSALDAREEVARDGKVYEAAEVLKWLLAIGNREVAAGKVKPLAQVIERLRTQKPRS